MKQSKGGGTRYIAETQRIRKFLDYKQYPNKNNLEEIEYIQPKNNIGIFILSQNNSYHKGCSTKGLRRFIYADTQTNQVMHGKQKVGPPFKFFTKIRRNNPI